MIYENMYNINEAFNRNGQSAMFCDRFLHFSHKTTLCFLIKDYHIKTINIMEQAATLFTFGIAMVVVGFVAFYVTTLDGSIFGVTHTPVAPKFELFFRTSSIRSSNFLRTKFEQVRRKFELLSSNFFESYKKEKHFGIYLIFVKFSFFFRKKMNFPGGPCFGSDRNVFC
jgi:hypothetical protein